MCRRFLYPVANPTGEARCGRKLLVPVDRGARQAALDGLPEGEVSLARRQHEALEPKRWTDGTLNYWSVAMLCKLKKRLQEASGAYFVGLKQFRATFIQRTIDALVAQGYRGRAAADAVMDATGHTKLGTVLNHDGRIRRQDSLRILREAREARVRVGQ